MDDFIKLLENGGTHSHNGFWKHLLEMSDGTCTPDVTTNIKGNLYFHHSSVPDGNRMLYSYVLAPWSSEQPPRVYSDVVNAMEDAHSGMQIEIAVPTNSTPLQRFATGRCCYSVFMEHVSCYYLE